MPKTVFITGGTSGIGRSLVQLYLGKGYQVHTCGRNQGVIDKLEQTYNAKTFSIQKIDLTKEKDCIKWINRGIALWSKIDILILNAGASMKSLISEEGSNKLTEALVKINFIANVQVVYSALPYIVKSKGIIAGISSIAGYVGLPGRSGYVASKAALNGWLDVLRKELYTSGVHITTIAPSFVASNIRKKVLDAANKDASENAIDENKIMTSTECAKRIYHSIRTKKRSLKMTRQGKLAIWLQHYVPKLADMLLYKHYIKNGKLIR